MRQMEAGGVSGSGQRSAAALLPLWLFATIEPGLFLRGFDGPIGQATACLLTSLVLAGLLISMRPTALFWRGHASALALFGLALLWLVAVFGVRWMFVFANSELPLAPDLFLPKFLGTLAGFWALVIGLLCSRLSGSKVTTADWILLLLTLYAALGLIQWFLLSWGLSQDWSVVYQLRFAGLIGNSNVTACICGAACVLAWGNLWYGYGKPGLAASRFQVLAAVALTINFLALLVTASRVAFFATVMAMAVQALRRRRERQTMTAPMHWRLAPMIAVAGGVLLIIWTQAASGLMARLNVLDADSAQRWAIWRHFAENVPAALWTGYGSGSFASLNLYTMNGGLAHYRLWAVNSSHNLLIQLLLVGGIPYLVLMTAGAAMIAADIFGSALWTGRDERFAALVLGAFVILAGGVVDIALDLPAGVIVLALLAGLAWGQARDSR